MPTVAHRLQLLLKLASTMHMLLDKTIFRGASVVGTVANVLDVI
jgi:hypothetical protein